MHRAATEALRGLPECGRVPGAAEWGESVGLVERLGGMVHQSFDVTAAGCDGIIIYLLTDIIRYMVILNVSQQKRRIICQRC